MAQLFKKSQSGSDQQTRRRRWLIGALAAFVVIDIALVGWALGANKSPSSTVAPIAPPPATTSAVPSPAPSATAEPSEEPQPADAAPAVRSTRLLAALDADTAWRATTGSCPATLPTLQITTDAGESWADSNLTDPTDSAALLRLNVSSEQVATGIALDAENCAPQFVQTYVAGENWVAYPEQTDDAWYLMPSGTVHSPQGDTAAPCETVVALAPSSDDAAAVLCSDHAVYRTTNAGDSWSEPVDVPASAAIAVSGGGYVVAVSNHDSCEGVQLFTLGDDAATPSGECHTTSFEPGELALAQAGDTVWLWAGDDLVRSEDGGATWQ